MIIVATRELALQVLLIGLVDLIKLSDNAICTYQGARTNCVIGHCHCVGVDDAYLKKAILHFC